MLLTRERSGHPGSPPGAGGKLERGAVGSAETSRVPAGPSRPLPRNGRPRRSGRWPEGVGPGVPREIRDVSCTAVPDPAGRLAVGSSAFVGDGRVGGHSYRLVAKPGGGSPGATGLAGVA